MYLVNILILYNLLEYLRRSSIVKKLDSFGELGHFVANTVGLMVYTFNLMWAPSWL